MHKDPQVDAAEVVAVAERKYQGGVSLKASHWAWLRTQAARGKTTPSKLLTEALERFIQQEDPQVMVAAGAAERGANV